MSEKIYLFLKNSDFIIKLFIKIIYINKFFILASLILCKSALENNDDKELDSSIKKNFKNPKIIEEGEHLKNIKLVMKSELCDEKEKFLLEIKKNRSGNSENEN